MFRRKTPSNAAALDDVRRLPASPKPLTSLTKSRSRPRIPGRAEKALAAASAAAKTTTRSLVRPKIERIQGGIARLPALSSLITHDIAAATAAAAVRRVGEAATVTGAPSGAQRSVARRIADAEVWSAAAILAGGKHGVRERTSHTQTVQSTRVVSDSSCPCTRGEYWRTVIPCSCHKAGKPYGCPHCPKMFTQCGSRNTHIKVVHQKIKEHRCAQAGCGKAYGQRGDLTRHIEAEHQKMSRFICDSCGRAFPRKYSLSRHVEAVHSAH